MNKRIVTLACACALLLGVRAGDRAETLKWFLENEYGVRPAAAEKPDVTFTEVAPARELPDGSAVHKRVRVDYRGPYGTNSFVLVAFIPKSAKPVPATLLLSNRPGVMPIDESDGGHASSYWPRDEIVSRGYAAVTFYLSDLAQETYVPATALRSGVFPVYERFEDRKPNSWGVLSAWAWGASRVLDWMETEPSIDATKVMVVGHSRGGKCALVAGNTDTRFAMVVSNNSGTGGARLNKQNLPFSEPWRSFEYFGVSYWFCDNYRRTFANDNGMGAPHDQDEWLALVAPRVLAVRSGSKDEWAGPAGERAATKRAAETWKAMGVPGNVAYGVREGGHGLMREDWRFYLDLADRRLLGAKDGQPRDAVTQKVELGAPFADHAVLQRGTEVPVWGRATPGHRIEVEFADAWRSATAGADGRWQVKLPPMEASKEGRTLKVTAREPGLPRRPAVAVTEVRDVLVGEVWFACGQSNMECPIWHDGNSRYRDGRGAMMTAMTRMPDVRFVKTPRAKPSAAPGTLRAEWLPFEPKSFVAPPESDHWKLLSAVAWYYARELRIALDVPIGIVESSFGGTGISAWTPGGGLWNSMVADYAPMAMRGLIWYQGENDAKSPEAYCGKMHALYDGWAKAFGNPRLKLYFAQLAPFRTGWLGLAQAQAKFAEEEPNAAIAVTADVGNPDDIHPNEKETVARRLALHALKRDYGLDIPEDDSPVFRSAEVRGDLAVLRFDHVKTWYVYNRDFTFGVPFELAGEDGVWKPARIVNCGKEFLENQKRGFIGSAELHLKGEGVEHPVAVRYMGGERPAGALYNQASLPLGPFEVRFPRTFCNPLSIEDYPVGMFCRGFTNGTKAVKEPETWLTPDRTIRQFRELADPSILCDDGKWYLFPSGDLCWKSGDGGATWTHVPLRLSGADGGKDRISYAPTICRHRGKYLLVGGTGHVFEGETPEGPFRDLGVLNLPRWGEDWNWLTGNPPALWDPNYFSDDDGRLYFYWGCSPTNGIWGVEIDAKDPLKLISTPKRLIAFEPRTQPWEIAPGKSPEMGYVEGAWMVKHDGKYILTYAAAGTENKEYAMGQAVGDSPLGPFVKPRNNPFFRKTEGFITGTSHGAVAKGPDGGWWVAYTINASCVHWYERRLGLDRIGFDADGSLKVTQATDTPQWLPGYGTGATGWTRLVAKSSQPDATDLSFRTYWKPDALPATLQVDFGGEKTVRSYRLIWRDCGLDTERGVRKGPFRYRVEALAGGEWKTLVDASKNSRDLLVDYRETEPVKATAARLVVLGGPQGITPGVVDFSPFGDADVDLSGGLRLPCAGLKEPVRFWVIADSHLNLRDERDAQYAENCKWISGEWGGKITCREAFLKILKEAKEQKPDLLVMAGDMINFPTLANIEFAKRELDACGIPWIYVAGNHDWHLRYEPGKPEDLRRKWTTTRMAPLYQGADPQFASRVVKGVRFVMIDNSLHNVTPEQTAFFRAEAAKGDPVCLVMHIPFWHEGWGYDTCACPDWEKRDRGWETQLLGAPRADRQDESTFAFRAAVESTPNLVGVFAGHVHRWQFAQDPTVLHVTATGAMFGECLKVTLVKQDEGKGQ